MDPGTRIRIEVEGCGSGYMDMDPGAGIWIRGVQIYGSGEYGSRSGLQVEGLLIQPPLRLVENDHKV